MRLNEPVTDHEIEIPDGDPLVSKTDTEGRITFANRTFIEVSGYGMDELIGAPHNLVRHPDMPRAAFADLWETIKAGRPWEGLVKNRAKSGDFYWVRANITPLIEADEVTGYISIRSKPTREQIAGADAAYRALREGQGGRIGLRDGLLVGSGFRHRLWTWLSRVSSRLALTGAVVGVLIGIIGFLGLQGMSASNQALHRVYERAAVDTAHVTDVRAAMRANVQSVTLMALELSTNRAALTDELIKSILSNDDRIDRLLREYMQTDMSPMQAILAHQLIEQKDAYVREGLLPAIALARQADAAGLDQQLHSRVMSLFSAAAATNNKLVDLQVKQAAASLADATEDLRLRFRMAIGALAAGAVVLAGLGIGLLRTVKTPLRRLAESFAAIARNDLSHDIGNVGAPEFWQIVSNLRAMRAGLMFGASERTEFERRTQTERRKAVQGMAEQVEREAGHAMERVATDTAEMARQADSVAEMTQRVSQNAQSVTDAAGHALANAQAVGAASEELSASIQEIAAQIGQATAVARRAAETGGTAQQQIQSLSEGALRIGDVVQLIRTIAGQTNLLALNATIEAARAGEAGRGFNVVASEVKGLAGQTARSTEEISRQVQAIQDATSSAVAVVAELGQSIEEIAQVFNGVAAAIEEQAAATQEIARNVAENSMAVQAVTERIGDVSRDAVISRERADGIRSGSATVADSIAVLRGSLVRTIRTATTDADRRMYTRALVDEPCSVVWRGGTFKARLADVSVTGARLFTTQPMPVGSTGTLGLEHAGGDASAGFEVRSQHQDGSIGVAFDAATTRPAFVAAIERLTAGAGHRAA
jgi:methyl-accepting chemotaxis protein/aerotaxis receptor